MEPKPSHQLTIVVGIVERNGKFLILRRVDENPLWHHKWELPGGKIELNETPVDALRREVREEAGIEINSPRLVGIHTHHWHLPDRIQQTFLLVHRAQTDSDAVTLLPEENDAHQWVTADQYLAMDDCLEGNKDMVMALYTSAANAARA